MADFVHSLLQLIQSRTARVGVMGLGYAGLPLARAFANSGFAVLGFDLEPTKVAQLQTGQSYLAHISSDDIALMRSRGFEATANFDRLAEPDALLICVPTPVTTARDPDLSHVVYAARAFAARLRPGQLVVLESTTYPGTTRELILPTLQESKLRIGEECFLAYSPEREDPGNRSFSTSTVPRVVGAIDPHSLTLACALYRAVVDCVVPLSSPEAAEAAKLLENTYRAVNIALVNEMKVLYDRMGIDIWEVIAAAKTKPFGFQAFHPGPGVGGDCIPVDPLYLTWAARRIGAPSRFVEMACAINATMPAYVARKVADALTDRGKLLKGSRVAVLGIAYKRDVADCRESPGLVLLELLTRDGALVCYNDPHVPALPASHSLSAKLGESQALTSHFLAAQDAIVIITDHSAYDWRWIVEHSPLVIDTRNATRDTIDHRDKIVCA